MEPNFRVAGRLPPGKLKAHPIHLLVNIPTSIPAKISTILLDEKAIRGFGSTANRFDEPAEDDFGPGPGRYEAHNMPDFTIDKRGGSGGFASKTNRFKMIIRRSPAPDAYQRVLDIKPKNSLSPSILIKRTLKNSSLHHSAPIRGASADAGIGPGSYDPKDPRIVSGCFPVCAAFRSRSERGSLGRDSAGTVPDPGTYDVRTSLIRTHAPVLGRAPHTPRGVFVGASLTRLPDDLANEVLMDERGKMAVGPGSYDPRRPSSGKAVTSAFAPRQGKADGEGEQAVDDEAMPGPGTYDPQLSRSRSNAAKAAFRSRAKKNAILKEVNANPGPSYYKPRAMKSKESFINNAFNRWL
jgi:hypothetical protein